MGNNSKGERIKLVVQIALVFGILCFLGLMIYTNLFHYSAYLDSDSASEAVLAKLIWEKKELCPASWYSSTEQRVISTPNLAALFYGLTHDAGLAMGIGCCVMMLGILAGIYYLLTAAGESRTMKLGILFLSLALPASIEALNLTYLFSSYYGIHVVFLFLILGFYTKAHKKGGWHTRPAMIGVILSYALGIQGFRGILVIFVPLVVIESIKNAYTLIRRQKVPKRDIYLWIWSVALLLSSYAGTFFPGSVPQGISRNLRKGFSKLCFVVIPDVLDIIGFGSVSIYGKMSLLVLCVGTLVTFVILMHKFFRRRDISSFEWAYLFLWCSLVVSMFAVSFTTVESSNRYGFMAIYILAFSTTITIQRAKKPIKWLFSTAVIILSISSIKYNYIPMLQAQEPPMTDSYRVVQYLEENGYTTAYATFESANKMTVLSDEVTVAAVASVDKMDICKWLTSSDWYVPNVPYEQETVYIITDEEAEEFEPFRQVHAKELTELPQIGKYHLYAAPYNYSNLGEE